MDEKLWKYLYTSCFQNEDEHVTTSETYQKAKERADAARKALVDVCADNNMKELMEDYEDALFNLLDAYRYADFKFQFISGIRMGLSVNDFEDVPDNLEEIIRQLKD